MHYLVNSLPYKTFKRFIWLDGDKFLAILWGINVEGGQPEPIYRPFLRVWRTPGILYAEFPGVLLMLMKRKPFIYFERSNVVTLEDD
jgi:hypothetical protein